MFIPIFLDEIFDSFFLFSPFFHSCVLILIDSFFVSMLSYSACLKLIHLDLNRIVWLKKKNYKIVLCEALKGSSYLVVLITSSAKRIVSMLTKSKRVEKPGNSGIVAFASKTSIAMLRSLERRKSAELNSVWEVSADGWELSTMILSHVVKI